MIKYSFNDAWLRSRLVSGFATSPACIIFVTSITTGRHLLNVSKKSQKHLLCLIYCVPKRPGKTLSVDSEICRVHCDGLFTKSSALPAAPGRVAEHFVNTSWHSALRALVSSIRGLRPLIIPCCWPAANIWSLFGPLIPCGPFCLRARLHNGWKATLQERTGNWSQPRNWS